MNLLIYQKQSFKRDEAFFKNICLLFNAKDTAVLTFHDDTRHYQQKVSLN